MTISSDLLPPSILLAAGSALAQAPSYPDFSDTTGLTLNGAAAQDVVELRLTSNAASEEGP